jgi:hypothetical protein
MTASRRVKPTNMTPKTNTAPIGWDVDEIYRRLGGTQGVIAHCARWAPASTPPLYNTAAVWKHRQSIPAEWVPTIVFGLLTDGLVPASDYRVLFAERAPSMEDVGL